jgi:DNA-binding response OmpR family regulator
MMSKGVLICDDDEGILEVTRIILQSKGFQVETLSNSEMIYQKIDEFKPDLILLDLWMPVLSGEEITRTLKSDKNYSQIPIIIFSANKDTKKVAQEIGADDYLSKPFNIEELETIVEKNIRK